MVSHGVFALKEYGAVSHIVIASKAYGCVVSYIECMESDRRRSVILCSLEKRT